MLLARGILELKDTQGELLSSFEMQGEPLSKIAAGWETIASLSRAILHVFDEKFLSAGQWTRTKPEDVFLFTQYSGPKHFIRAIKGVFQQGWWATEVAEITRTAGTRAILQPTVTALDSQLKDTLGSGADAEVSAVSTATLQQIVAQFDEIVKGLRAVELATLAAKYEGIAMAVTKHLINSPTSSIDGARVDCAFKMMRYVCGMPSSGSAAHGLMQELTTWATKTKSLRGVQECIQLLSATTRSDVKFEEVAKLVPADISTVSPEVQVKIRAGAVNFLHMGLLKTMDEVIFVMEYCVLPGVN